MGQLKILLVGARGFVGSNIFSRLESKYSVIPITSADNIDFADFTSVKNLLDQTCPDIVINCLTYGAKQVTGGDTAEVTKNLAMFYNFLKCSDLFSLYINVGSGAEFDRFSNVDNVNEWDINYIMPLDSYGFTKNTIARSIQTVQNQFYTLRLFGCFGANEWPSRLLPKFLNSKEEFLLEDRFFDYISAEDFVKVVEYIITDRPQTHDINCVYSEKYLLSDFLMLFCKLHQLNKKFTATKQSQNNYTGNGTRLNYIKNQIKLQGLEQGLRDYL